MRMDENIAFKWSNENANALILSKNVSYPDGLIFDILGGLSLEGKKVQLTIGESSDGEFHVISPRYQNSNSGIISFLVLTSNLHHGEKWIDFLCRPEMSVPSITVEHIKDSLSRKY